MEYRKIKYTGKKDILGFHARSLRQIAKTGKYAGWQFTAKHKKYAEQELKRRGLKIKSRKPRANKSSFTSFGVKFPNFR